MSEALAAPEFDPAADLAAAFRSYMESMVHLQGPSANTRASSIGGECERALYYERTVPAEQRVRYAPELAAIFELGKDMEKIAVRRLEDMGADIVQRGRDYLDARHQLSGHVDAKIRMPAWPRAIPVEIKGLNPYTGESIETLDDIRESRQAWVRKYYAQLEAYLLLAGEELGAFVLFNKSTGWPRFINCPLDYQFAEGLLKKAERLKLAVVQAEPPARTEGTHCQKCQFLAVCAPNMSFGQPAQILDDGELESAIQRWLELKAAAAEYDVIDREIKFILGQREGEILVGEYVIARTKRYKAAEAKPRKASTFFVSDVRKVEGPK